MNILNATYKTLNKTNILLSKNKTIVETKRKSINNLLSIVNDKTKSDETIKQEVRKLIVDKITDGTTLTDNDRIDIVECAWITYRLNRESGRSRVVSWMLASAVLIDSLGLVLCGKKNKLRELTRTIIKQAKRPAIYAFVIYLTRSFMLFLPELIMAIGHIFNLSAVINLGTFLKKSPINIIRAFINKDVDMSNIGISSVQGLIGISLVSLGKKLSELFYLIYGVYVMMFTSIRDRTTKVSRDEINQNKPVFGLENNYIKRNNVLKESIDNDEVKKARLTISIVSNKCLYRVLKDGYDKLSYGNMSESSTKITLNKLRSQQYLKTEVALAAITGAAAAIRPIVAFLFKTVLFILKSIIFPFIKCLDGIITGLYALLGLWYRDIKAYIKECMSSSVQNLENEDLKIKKKLIKISKNNVFKGKFKDIRKVITKVDKVANKAVIE